MVLQPGGRLKYEMPGCVCWGSKKRPHIEGIFCTLHNHIILAVFPHDFLKIPQNVLKSLGKLLSKFKGLQRHIYLSKLKLFH